MTAHEWAERTVKDIQDRRKKRAEGIKQADMHVYINRERIQRRLQYGRR